MAQIRCGYLFWANPLRKFSKGIGLKESAQVEKLALEFLHTGEVKKCLFLAGRFFFLKMCVLITLSHGRLAVLDLGPLKVVAFSEYFPAGPGGLPSDCHLEGPLSDIPGTSCAMSLSFDWEGVALSNQHPA